ncbi:MAG: transporter substrate-binding domain-containing protein [Rhodobacteraceae bacterium]|nr:transporter substrate-binding domain-containing protein [Paracoccaceae bacterium]
MDDSEKTGLLGIAQGGVLRAAINTGNRALVQQNGERLAGVSPALAQRLADSLDLRLEAVVYSGAGKVFEDAGRDVWDVAFLAIDATRAERVSFTRPYHTIEATYAVRSGSGISSPKDADRDGITVLSSIGSAYDFYLASALRHARHDRIGTPTESFEAFRAGRADVVAGVRASLERFFEDDPEVRILPGVLTKVEQAMVLPGRDNPQAGDLDAFVASAIEDGFVGAHVGAKPKGG